MKKIFIILSLFISCFSVHAQQGVDQNPQSWFNVKDYGIKGDSTTDNTSKLQALVNFVPQGSTIFFPNGKFRTTGTIYVGTTAIRFLFSNFGRAPNNNGDYPITSAIVNTNSNDSAFAILNSASGVRFENAAIIYTGAGTASSGSRGIYFGTAQDAIIDYSQFFNFAIDVETKNGGEYRFSNSYFYNSTTYNLQLQDSLSPDNGDGSVVNCIFATLTAASTGADHINYISGGGLKLIAPKFSSNGSTKAKNCINMSSFAGTVDFFCTGGFSAENFTGSFLLMKTPPSGLENFVIADGEIAPASGTTPMIYFDGTTSSPSIHTGIIDHVNFVGTTTDTGIYLKNATYITIGVANNFYQTGALMQVIYDGSISFNSNVSAQFPDGIQAVTPASLKATIDGAGGDIFAMTLTGNDTIYIANGNFGRQIRISMTQDGTGGRVPVLPAGGTNFIGGSISTIGVLSTAGATSIVEGYINASRQLTVTNILYNGSTIANPMTTLGDIIYENSTPAPTRLAGNTAATLDFLSQIGNGSISAAPIWKTPTQVTAALNVFTSSLQGLVPASGGGTTTFLRADGTFATPAGGGSGTPGGSTTDMQFNSGGTFAGSNNNVWDSVNFIQTVTTPTTVNTAFSSFNALGGGTAAAGSQVDGGAYVSSGSGWKTNATAGAQAVLGRWLIQPTQGAANPTADILFQLNINGGGYNTAMDLNYISGTGTAMLVNGATQYNSANLAVNGKGDVSGNMFINSTSSSTGIEFQNATQEYLDMLASGEGLNVRTNAQGLSAMHLDGGNGGAATFGSLSNQATSSQVEAVSTTLSQYSAVYDGTHHTELKTNSSGNFSITPSNGQTSIVSSIILPYVAKTTTYSIAVSDYMIDCTSGTFTVTLPTAVGVAGKIYVVKNSGTGVITIATTSSQTIDGASTETISTQYGDFTMMSDGANYKIISNH
jgi:Pectate lyase superfamily protein